MDSLLKKQIEDSAGNVQYTFVSHWNIVNRLEGQYKGVKITQIVLTALSTGGFLASLIAGIPALSWVGGLASALALGLNLYTLNFNYPEMIRQHTAAANDLWEVREAFKSLIVDMRTLDDEIVRNRRDALNAEISRINRNYPGTDKKSFKETQKNIMDYIFDDGEAAKVIGANGKESYTHRE